MKQKVNIFLVILMIVLLSGCYDRVIIDFKEFNHSLPDVENLDYTKQGNIVSLTWQLPSTISPDFKRPLEVSIQVVENNIYRQKVVVGNESTVTDISINTSKRYRFIVKLLGYLTDEAREEGKTDRVYSDGQAIEIE